MCYVLLCVILRFEDDKLHLFFACVSGAGEGVEKLKILKCTLTRNYIYHDEFVTHGKSEAITEKYKHRKVIENFLVSGQSKETNASSTKLGPVVLVSEE